MFEFICVSTKSYINFFVCNKVDESDIRQLYSLHYMYMRHGTSSGTLAGHPLKTDWYAILANSISITFVPLLMNQNQNIFDIFKNQFICVNRVYVSNYWAQLKLSNSLGAGTPFPETEKWLCGISIRHTSRVMSNEVYIFDCII